MGRLLVGASGRERTHADVEWRGRDRDELREPWAPTKTAPPAVESPVAARSTAGHGPSVLGRWCQSRSASLIDGGPRRQVLVAVESGTGMARPSRVRLFDTECARGAFSRTRLFDAECARGASFRSGQARPGCLMPNVPAALPPGQARPDQAV